MEKNFTDCYMLIPVVLSGVRHVPKFHRENFSRMTLIPQNLQTFSLKFPTIQYIIIHNDIAAAVFSARLVACLPGHSLILVCPGKRLYFVSRSLQH